jgi:hypothetical protein
MSLFCFGLLRGCHPIEQGVHASDEAASGWKPLPQGIRIKGNKQASSNAGGRLPFTNQDSVLHQLLLVLYRELMYKSSKHNLTSNSYFVQLDKTSSRNGPHDAHNQYLKFPFNPETGNYEARQSRTQSLQSHPARQGHHTSRPGRVSYFRGQDGSIVQDLSRSSQQQTGSRRPSSLSRHHRHQGSADHSLTRRTVINLVELSSSKPRRHSQASDRTYDL